MERQKARRAMDSKGVDRIGKDIDHKRPLSKGGTNNDGNLRLVSPSTNRSFARNADGSVKSNNTRKKQGVQGELLCQWECPMPKGKW